MAVAAGLALLAAGLLTGSWFAGGRTRFSSTYQRLTYRRGFISNARFAPDGQTILYSADWDGAPSRIFSTRAGGRESTALPLPSASLLSVSSRGEMAILLDPEGIPALFERLSVSGRAIVGYQPRADRVGKVTLLVNTARDYYDELVASGGMKGMRELSWR